MTHDPVSVFGLGVGYCCSILSWANVFIQKCKKYERNEASGWNSCSLTVPMVFFSLRRNSVNTCPAWQSSAIQRGRTRSSPQWSSWTTCITSAPSATSSMVFSTASTTNGKLGNQRISKQTFLLNSLTRLGIFVVSLSVQPLCYRDHEPGSVDLS